MTGKGRMAQGAVKALLLAFWEPALEDRAAFVEVFVFSYAGFFRN